jgi:hypothetical protein
LDSEIVQIPGDEESCSYITEEECDACDANEDTPLNISSDKTEVFQPALRFSAFSGVPPYLNFCLHDEKGIRI